MWYFFNHRRVDFADAQPGIFANRNAGDPTKWTYVPDFSRQGRIDQKRRIFALRLTMQLTPKNKLSRVLGRAAAVQRRRVARSDDGCMSNKDGWIYGGSQDNGFFGAGPNSPETGDYASTHQKVQQVKYTAPTTNKLLLEAGFGTYISQWGYSERPGNPTKNLVRVQEQPAQIFDRNGNRVATPCDGCLTVGGNLKYRSSNWPTGYIFAHTWNAAASYVTGAHNMKFGYQGAFHRDDDNLFPTISNDSCGMRLHLQHRRAPRRHVRPTRLRAASRCSQACSRAKCAPSTTRSTHRSSGRRIGSRCRARCVSTTRGAASPSSRSVRR